jgi:hypothetical protein
VRNCSEIILAMVGRPKSGLDLFKEEIVYRYQEGEQYSIIALDYRVSGRTLEHRIKSWGVQKRLPKRKSKTDPLGDSEVRIFIGICWDRNLSDQEIQYTIESNGWKLIPRTIANICRDIGILRRVSVFQQQERVSQLWEVIQKELERGTISRYSRGYLHVYFKKIFRQLGYQISQYIYIKKNFKVFKYQFL